MAAVIVAPRPYPSPGVVPGRPHLRVVRGGRDDALRARRATFRRRRLLAAVVGAALLGLVYFAVLGAVGVLSAPDAAAPAPSAAAPPAVSADYVVHPGDTLWTIARRLQPDGDVRPLVDQLAEANGGAALQVGQHLVLPPLE